MANPADRNFTLATLPEGQLAQLRTQVNNLSASLRLLTAKLDADAGVTDTTYGSLITDAAIATAPVVLTGV